MPRRHPDLCVGSTIELKLRWCHPSARVKEHLAQNGTYDPDEKLRATVDQLEDRLYRGKTKEHAIFHKDGREYFCIASNCKFISKPSNRSVYGPANQAQQNEQMTTETTNSVANIEF